MDPRFPGDHISQPSNKLSPDFARRSPEEYKLALFNTMKAKAPTAYAVLARLHHLGILTPDKIKLLEDPEGLSGAYTASHEIDLNVQPLPAAKKKEDIFEDARFSGDMEIVYVLNHEISHLVSFLAIRGKLPSQDVCEEITSMSQAFLDMRKHELESALTRQGTVESYRISAIEEGIHPGLYQALEDIAELINMFTLDPKYLKSYLNFLSDPACAEQRKMLHLKEIDQEVAGVIYDSIARCIKDLLGK